MRTNCIAAVLALATIAGVSTAISRDGDSLVGQDAPAITTSDFLQSKGRTSVADFKGEVLMVECFATWCGPCVGMMPHLSKLTEEYGKKGFTVLSISKEPRETVLKFLTQLNNADVTYTMGCGGGTQSYPAPGIPKAFLIGVDGKVFWEGHPAALPTDLLEQELKKVKITPEMRATTAQASLAYAEKLISANEVLRATGVLAAIAKDHKGTEAAKQAEERSAAIAKDPKLSKELAAQKQIDKLVGGLELPKEKLKSKERVAKSEQLLSLAAKCASDAPASSEMAKSWAKVLKEDWKSKH
jgi:thiol-disulfide isomerase/thioredoxin